MIKMHLRAADLAETTFAISPLQATVFSLWVWWRPERHPFHLPWRRAMREPWHGCDREVLQALMAPGHGWVPDFITPRPTGPVTEFDTELQLVADTSWRKVRADLAAAYRGVALPDALRDSPSSLRDRVVDALDGYHRACIEPQWPRMRAVLEGDIAYRGRQLVTAGARGLFDDLDARVRWDGGQLSIDRMSGHEQVVEIDGRGLPLVPSLFLRGAVTYLSAAEPPVLCYPARGRAAVWESATPPLGAALVELIGRPRARLLTMLHEPASTTELARRLEVSAGAVSQHLGALHDARLVTRTRSGRSVLYLRSELADALIGG